MIASGLELVEGGDRGRKDEVVSGLSGGPPQKICPNSNPRSLCYIIWKKGLCRHNKVKDEMRSSWILSLIHI